MSIYEREDEYITWLSQRPYTVKELAGKLFISEPTVRRDIAAMRKKELVDCKRGMVRLRTNSPDRRIPLFIRDMEHNEKKQVIAAKAASHIKDGDIVMLDASTTAYCLIPYLGQFKHLFVITSGAKAAVAVASMGIRTLCTGGEMALESFSFVGADAEHMLCNYNADLAFFSCRGLTEDGMATDNSILENAIRKIMIQTSAQRFLLCDSSKFGNRYLNTLCRIEEITGIISDT